MMASRFASRCLEVRPEDEKTPENPHHHSVFPCHFTLSAASGFKKGRCVSTQPKTFLFFNAAYLYEKYSPNSAIFCQNGHAKA